MLAIQSKAYARSLEGEWHRRQNFVAIRQSSGVFWYAQLLLAFSCSVGGKQTEFCYVKWLEEVTPPRSHLPVQLRSDCGYTYFRWFCGQPMGIKATHQITCGIIDVAQGLHDDEGTAPTCMHVVQMAPTGYRFQQVVVRKQRRTDDITVENEYFVLNPDVYGV